MPNTPVGKIIVANRHRRDLGDIDALKASIADLGLLHAIVTDSKHNLIAGRRRLAAVTALGWTEVPTQIAANLDDIYAALRAERDENTCRKELAPTESVALAESLKPFEEKAAKERRASSNAEREKFSPSTKGAAATKVAEAVGMSRPTLAKAAKVVEAAKREPDVFGDLPKKMDDQKKVDPVYRELVRREAKRGLPEGKTPHQQANEDAARRWAKGLHEVYVHLNSFRDVGGMTKLAMAWNIDQRNATAKELRRIIDRLDAYLTELTSLESEAA